MRELYTKAAAVAVPLFQSIDDDQLDGPSPCAQYTVRGLANHLFRVVVEFQKAARREEMDFATERDFITGDWRERFAAETAALTQAWSAPGALDDESSAMGLPRQIVAQLPIFDLTVHSWDIARSTGRAYPVDTALVEAVYAMALQLADKGREAGQFGVPVEVAADAPVIDKLVGLIGRDPAWKP